MAQVGSGKNGTQLEVLDYRENKTGARRLKTNMKKPADGLSLEWGRGGEGDDPDRSLGRGKDRKGAGKGAGQTEELGGRSCVRPYLLPGLHYSRLVV